MEIVFLLVGLALMAVGVLVIVSEVRARRGTEPVPARVIGFSTGKSDSSKVTAFHTVVEYNGRDGCKYYVEGSVGSSVPFHAVGDTVTVLVDPSQPAKALLESRISFILGGVLALMGLFSFVMFGVTFQPTLFSVAMAAFIIGGLIVKGRTLRREKPLSMEAWKEYKKKILSTRVFTDETKEQIAWADPGRVVAAIKSYRKTNRFAAPTLLVLGLGLLLLGYHFYTKTETFLRMADRASGYVVDLRENNSGDGSPTYAAVVEYRNNRGQNFKFVDSFSSSPPTYHTGQIVDVLYNREDPREAQIDRGLLNHWVWALLSLLGVMFLMFGFHVARRRLRAGKSF
jgi:Protein of unknown function (DUF3592)